MIAETPTVCPAHPHRELFPKGYMTANWNNWKRIPSLGCPEPGCTALEGKICDRCTDALVPTQRRPDLDEPTEAGDATYAAWICPRCGYNNWEIE